MNTPTIHRLVGIATVVNVADTNPGGFYDPRWTTNPGAVADAHPIVDGSGKTIGVPAWRDPRYPSLCINCPWGVYDPKDARVIGQYAGGQPAVTYFRSPLDPAPGLDKGAVVQTLRSLSAWCHAHGGRLGVNDGPVPNNDGIITTAEKSAIARIYKDAGIDWWVSDTIGVTAQVDDQHRDNRTRGFEAATYARNKSGIEIVAEFPEPPNWKTRPFLDGRWSISCMDSWVLCEVEGSWDAKTKSEIPFGVRKPRRECLHPSMRDLYRRWYAWVQDDVPARLAGKDTRPERMRLLAEAGVTDLVVDVQDFPVIVEPPA